MSPETITKEGMGPLIQKAYDRYGELIKELNKIPHGVRQATVVGIAIALVEGITRNKEHALETVDLMAAQIRKGRDTRTYRPQEQP